MTTFRAEFVENKSPDWKVASLKDPSGVQTTDVSINRTNKKGEVFPNFDAIQPGADVNGELWQSSTGKWYLFGPKTATAPRTGSQNIAKAVAQKNENIKANMEHKDVSILTSSTFRDATSITIEVIKKAEEPLSDEDIQATWLKWRTWLIENWDVDKRDLSVPF